MNNLENIFIVLYDANGVNEFLTCGQLDRSIISKDNNEVIDRYCEAFKDKQLYFNFAGVPNAFNNIIDIHNSDT